MPRKKNMYKFPELDIDLMGEKTVTPDVEGTTNEKI